MNVAQARSHTWSPHVILFAVVLHVVLLYYIAVTFKILPSPLPTPPDPPAFQTVTLPPPPSVNVGRPDPITAKPIFTQRPTNPPPPTAIVQPSPLPATTPSTLTGPATIIVGTGVPEGPISRAVPPYPPKALRDDKEGQVVLSITILPDGNVTDVQIMNATPRGYFEEAAMRSVRTWRYAPSNVIRKNVIVHMDFVLRG